MLFAEMLPNHRRVPKSILKRDIEKLKQINKITGKDLKAATAHKWRAAQQSFVAASSTTSARAYPGTIAIARVSGSRGGGLGRRGGLRPIRQRPPGGNSGGRQQGGGAAAVPPSVPFTQAAQARLDYNKQLQATQQAMTSDSNGNFCRDCDKAGRTAHHYFKECAFSEGYRCKRGGHRAPAYTLPKFP